MLFNKKAHFFGNGNHFGTDVCAAVNRLYREVAAFNARAVTSVAAFDFATSVVWGFNVIQFEECMVAVVAELNIVEHKEFSFWAEICCVADTCACKISFCVFRNRAWVTFVTLTAGWIVNVTEDNQCWTCCKRIDRCCCHIWHQCHVGFVNRFPASDGRAIKHNAVFEHVFVNRISVHSKVLPFTFRVGKAKIYIFNFFVFDLLENVCNCHFSLSVI